MDLIGARQIQLYNANKEKRAGGSSSAAEKCSDPKRALKALIKNWAKRCPPRLRTFHSHWRAPGRGKNTGRNILCLSNLRMVVGCQTHGATSQMGGQPGLVPVLCEACLTTGAIT